jgi:hypothetical protein
MIEIFSIPIAAKIDQILKGGIKPITTVSYMSYVAFNILWQKISNAKNAACYILHKMI